MLFLSVMDQSAAAYQWFLLVFVSNENYPLIKIFFFNFKCLCCCACYFDHFLLLHMQSISFKNLKMYVSHIISAIFMFSFPWYFTTLLWLLHNCSQYFPWPPASLTVFQWMWQHSSFEPIETAAETNSLVQVRICHVVRSYVRGIICAAVILTYWMVNSSVHWNVSEVNEPC